MGTRFMYVGKEILIVRELSFTKKIENWEEGLEEILQCIYFSRKELHCIMR